MKKNQKKKLPVVIKILLVCGYVFLLIFFFHRVVSVISEYLSIPYTKLEFTENNDFLANPERGLYFQYDTEHYEAYYKYYNTEDNLNIILMAYDLEGYDNQKILDKEKIKELRAALDYAKDLGIGVVFRAAYSFKGEYVEPESFDIIISHVSQISPVLNEYKDIIIGVQAGFIGPFGEWHGSIYMDTPESGVPYRVQLVEKLIKSLDESIVINLRRQMFIREAQSFGVKINRIGIHNDALLATHSDMGTYVEEGYDREAELDWSEQNIKTPINGGEMPYVSDFTNIDNVVYEFDKLQITYLNRYYNQEVLEDWKTQTYNGINGYDYIVNHLGYRLSLAEVICAEKIKKNRTVNLSGIIRNTGFAKTLDDYQLYWVAVYNGSTMYEKMEYEFTSKERLSFKGMINIPDSWFEAEESSNIKIGIAMTNKENTIADEKFCIQFANNNVVYENGCNWFIEYDFDEEQEYFILK